MSNPTDYTCSRCGGVNNSDVLALFACPGYPMTITLCQCPRLLSHHDGGLDKRDPHDDCHGTVKVIKNYGLRDGEHVIEISGGYGDCENCRILLDPAQALSLLAWLEQERATLEQMVRDAEKAV